MHPDGVFEFGRVSGEELEKDRSAGRFFDGVAAVRLSLDSVGFYLVPAQFMNTGATVIECAHLPAKRTPSLKATSCMRNAFALCILMRSSSEPRSSLYVQKCAWVSLGYPSSMSSHLQCRNDACLSGSGGQRRNRRHRSSNAYRSTCSGHSVRQTHSGRALLDDDVEGSCAVCVSGREGRCSIRRSSVVILAEAGRSWRLVEDRFIEENRLTIRRNRLSLLPGAVDGGFRPSSGTSTGRRPKGDCLLVRRFACLDLSWAPSNWVVSSKQQVPLRSSVEVYVECRPPWHWKSGRVPRFEGRDAMILGVRS